jgi:type IV fimbrial biogenesis protein FimT
MEPIVSCRGECMKTYRPHSRAGFTLVELLVVLAILAILATIGLPSFQRLVADYRVASQANSVQGLLQFARTEAIKRTNGVIVCSDGTTLFVRVANTCAGASAGDTNNLRVLGLDGRIAFAGLPAGTGVSFAPSGYVFAGRNFDVSHPLVATRRIRMIGSGFSEVIRL